MCSSEKKLLLNSDFRFKFKVSRKSRSKQIWRSDDLRISSVEPAVKPVRSDATEVSCLSISAKAISTGSSCPNRGHERRTQTRNNLHRCGSNHINRRAEAILELLSLAGSLSEVRIRQELGDSPDTSKALRMCVKGQVELLVPTSNSFM